MLFMVGAGWKRLGVRLDFVVGRADFGNMRVVFLVASVVFGLFGWEVAVGGDRDLPIVVPVEGGKGGGTLRTTAIGNGYVIRSSDGRVYRATRLGDSWLVRGPKGETYRTTRVGSQVVTRGPGGEVIRTSRFGDGYISRDGGGVTHRTTRLGSQTVTSGKDGRTVRTTELGGGKTSWVSGGHGGKVLLVLPGSSGGNRSQGRP